MEKDAAPAGLSNDLKRKVAGAALWTVAARWIHRLLGMVSIVVLARLLEPKDFGLVAMAQVFSTIISAFTQLELNVALIRLKSIDTDYLSTAWTLGLIAGVLASLAILAVAWPAASYYEDGRIGFILVLFALLPTVSALRSPRMVFYAKHFQFDRSFYFSTSVRVVTVALTVALAFQFRDYRALVYGSLAGVVVSATASYFVMPWRPRLSLRRRKELWGISGWLLARNIASVARARMEPLLLGPAFGAERISFYHIGSEVGRMFTTALAQPLGKALLPAYAVAQGDRARTERGVLLGLAGITIVLPLGFGAAALSEELLVLVFGEKWLPAAPIFELIAMAAAIAALGSAFGSSILVRGDVKQLAFGNIAALAAIVLFVLAARPYDSLTVIAAGRGAIMVALFAYFFALGFRDLPDARVTAIGIIMRPLLAALLMYGCIVAAKSFVTLSPLLALAAYPVPGAAVFLVSLFVLWWVSGRPQGLETLLLAALDRARVLRLPTGS